MLWRLLRPVYAPLLGPPIKLLRRAWRQRWRVLQLFRRSNADLPRRECLVGGAFIHTGEEVFAWVPVRLWSPYTLYPTEKWAWLQKVIVLKLTSGTRAIVAVTDPRGQLPATKRP